MDTRITYTNLHKKEDNNISYKETNAHIMEQVMSSFMTGSSTESAEIIGYLQTVSKNVERIGSTPWENPIAGTRVENFSPVMKAIEPI